MVRGAVETDEMGLLFANWGTAIAIVCVSIIAFVIKHSAVPTHLCTLAIEGCLKSRATLTYWVDDNILFGSIAKGANGPPNVSNWYAACNISASSRDRPTNQARSALGWARTAYAITHYFWTGTKHRGCSTIVNQIVDIALHNAKYTIVNDICIIVDELIDVGRSDGSRICKINL
jgi:hypothetical protein